MSRHIDHMPDPAEDLAGCLEALATLYGDEWTFLLIGKIRDQRGPGEAGRVRAQLAKRLVDAEQREHGGDRTAAELAVGERLGYAPNVRGEGGTIQNFRKIARGTTRLGKPIAGADA